MRGWLAALAIVAFAMLVASWAVRVAEGRRSMLESDAAVARGDALEAILAARAAAEARCPFCTAPDRGFQRLEAIAKEAESRGDEWTAFASFRAMCAASIA